MAVAYLQLYRSYASIKADIPCFTLDSVEDQVITGEKSLFERRVIYAVFPVPMKFSDYRLEDAKNFVCEAKGVTPVYNGFITEDVEELCSQIRLSLKSEVLPKDERLKLTKKRNELERNNSNSYVY